MTGSEPRPHERERLRNHPRIAERSVGHAPSGRHHGSQCTTAPKRLLSDLRPPFAAAFNLRQSSGTKPDDKEVLAKAIGMVLAHQYGVGVVVEQDARCVPSHEHGLADRKHHVHEDFEQLQLESGGVFDQLCTLINILIAPPPTKTSGTRFVH